MALNGKLQSWNDERGFGFIAPRDGGRELFVHISSFPRDGSRPTVGETITYELGRGNDGKPQAVNVYRQALGRPTTYPRKQPLAARDDTRSPFAVFIGLAVLVALSAFGYLQYRQHLDRSRAASVAASPEDIRVESSPAGFRCDGRTYCSQMTSCTEAKYFLKNCPDTKMDGNHDGVPCEQQWCTSPFSR